MVNEAGVAPEEQSDAQVTYVKYLIFLTFFTIWGNAPNRRNETNTKDAGPDLSPYRMAHPGV
jgi:hypothetical protein